MCGPWWIVYIFPIFNTISCHDLSIIQNDISLLHPNLIKA